MANHPSALKRARQNETRKLRNRTVKTRVKNVVKSVRQDAATQTAETAGKNLNAAKSLIDKAAKKGRHPQEDRRAQDLAPRQAGERGQGQD